MIFSFNWVAIMGILSLMAKNSLGVPDGSNR
jgi:hypothetical protein